MLRRIAEFFDYQLGARRNLPPAYKMARPWVKDEDSAPTAFAKFGSAWEVPYNTGDTLPDLERSSVIGLKNELYQAAWTREPMPDPGAMNYAWQTIGLVQQTITGTGVIVSDMPRATSPATLAGFELLPFGSPTYYQQIAGQPLLDANNNAVNGGGLSGFDFIDTSMTDWNSVALAGAAATPYPMNNPYPQSRRL
jgi:hypothetical protein